MSELCTETQVERIKNQFSERVGIVEAVERAREHARLKQDFIVPTSAMEFCPNDDGVFMRMTEGGGDWRDLQFSEHALRQTSTWGKVPIGYVQRLSDEDPEFLSLVLNRELSHRNDSRMIRTYSDDESGFVRANLSTSYGRFGPEDLLEPLLGVFSAEKGKWKIQECSYTEHGFILNAVIPTDLHEIKLDDPVAFGIRAYTGDTGRYATGIDVLIHRLVCKNSMTAAERVSGMGYRRIHRGSKMGNNFVQLQSDTIDAEARYTQLQIRDTINEFTQGGAFERIADKMRAMANAEIEDPLGATQLLAKENSLSDEETKQLQNSMIREGDATVWGLNNALTDMARDLEDYDRKRDLEKCGGHDAGHGIVLEIPECQTEIGGNMISKEETRDAVEYCRKVILADDLSKITSIQSHAMIKAAFDARHSVGPDVPDENVGSILCSITALIMGVSTESLRDTVQEILEHHPPEDFDPMEFFVMEVIDCELESRDEDQEA